MGEFDEGFGFPDPGFEPVCNVTGPASSPAALSVGGVPVEVGEGSIVLGMAE